MNKITQDDLGYLLREDPEIEFRIENGIEQNRKGFGEIELVDMNGNPVSKATLKIRQLRHEFHFGCNAFTLRQLPEQDKNAAYEELFSDLFNLAVVPFYWSDLEPSEGKLRFESNSEFIYRRPPPDLVLDYCDKHSITPKGHPLLWHLFRPDWLGYDEMTMRRNIRRRFQQIAERYAQRIPIWDVCNEAQTLTVNQLNAHLPKNHVELAFELAQEFFPDCVKTYNDDRIWYHYSRTYTPVFLLVQSLLHRGYKVDALGLQFHMFEQTFKYAAKYLNPMNLLNCLDLYGSLGIPVNFSEISIISRKDMLGAAGDAFQETVVNKLYRLWFSHSSVNGIVWWNLVDGTAAYAPLGSGTGENRHYAGLVNYDMSPKPSYQRLRQLIHKEWRSNILMDYDEHAVNKFRAFYGDYEVTVNSDAGAFVKHIKLSKNALNLFRINLG